MRTSVYFHLISLNCTTICGYLIYAENGRWWLLCTGWDGRGIEQSWDTPMNDLGGILSEHSDKFSDQTLEKVSGSLVAHMDQSYSFSHFSDLLVNTFHLKDNSLLNLMESGVRFSIINEQNKLIDVNNKVKEVLRNHEERSMFQSKARFYDDLWAHRIAANTTEEAENGIELVACL